MMNVNTIIVRRTEFIRDFFTAVFTSRIFKALVIVVIAVILSKLAAKMIKRAVHKRDITNRLETLISVFSKIVSFLIYFFAALQICQVLFDMNPTSIIAATGVLGVAVGFGAQSLVKDVISGFFILFENQFAVGDSVTIEGFTGKVSELTLRTTILQGASGDLFTIPNGSISKVTNHSRCDRAVAIAVSIAYEEDIDKAAAVLEQVAKKAYEDIDSLVKEPDVLGVTALGSSGVELKILATCTAGEQFAVEREMLKRIKQAFDAQNVDIPYDHIVVMQK